MGKVIREYLGDDVKYCCKSCDAHICSKDNIVSRNFQGKTGKAYLFEGAVNLSFGPSRRRNLMTGRHKVADIYCNVCGSILGWKYDKAYEIDQEYKEGKYIVEMAKVIEK